MEQIKWDTMAFVKCYGEKGEAQINLITMSSDC